MPTELDALDRGILYLLQDDARATITHIAETLDVADNTVRNRIERLEEEAVIDGYSARVNYQQTEGYNHYYQFVCSVSISAREQLADDALSLPSVVSVRTVMSGSCNLIVMAVAEGPYVITDVATELDDLDGLTIEREELVRMERSRPFDGYQPETA